jgi:hypothetical protein
MTSDHENWSARAVRRFAWMLAGVVALFAATETAALAGVSPYLRPVSVHDVTTNILFAIGFGSPLVLHLSSLPGWRETAMTLLLGVVGAGLWLLPWVINWSGLYEPPTDADKQMIACRVVIMFGLASILVLAGRAWRGPRRTEALLYLLPALVALVFTLQAGMFMNFTAAYFPTPYDHFAYATDAAHGFQVSFAVGRLFAAAPLLKWVCFVVYVAPSPALVFVYTLQVRSKRPPPVDVVTELLVLVIVGYAFYFFFPVCGPQFAFGAAFPNDPPRVADVLAHPPAIAGAWRNGMPSLHLGSVVLAYWLARPYGAWVRVVAAAFVAGNVLATMGLGEHYFVDLVVALPFTLAAHSALTPGRQPYRAPRRRALWGAVAFLAVWYVVLYGGWTALLRFRGSAWAVTIPTVAAVVLLERDCYRAIMGARA